MNARACAVLLVVAAGLGAPRPAAAQSVYEVHATTEVPFSAFALLVSALPQLDIGHPTPARCLPECRAESVNVLDRWVIGHNSLLAENLSNVLILAMPIMAISMDFADVQGSALWRDAAVALEAYSAHALALAFTKFGFRRPRPYVYDPTHTVVARSNPESILSFFSGHTSSAFVTAVTFSETWRRRHDVASSVVVYGVSLSLAFVVAACRMLAGKHFLTDVFLAASVGTAFGLVIPALHDR